MFYRVHSINGKDLAEDVNKNCLDFPRDLIFWELHILTPL